MNALKVTFLMLILILLFSYLGFYFGGQNGMIIAFLIAAGMNFFSYWFSDKIVLKMYKAHQITEADHPRYYSIVQNISNVAMVPMPKVYVVPSKAPNAFATGRNAEHAAVAVTEGLLGILDDGELEGVICHEFAHIVNKDMLIGTIAATFAGAIGIIATIARFSAIFYGGGRDNNRGGLFGLLIAAIIAPIVALIIQTAISRKREYKADETGGRFTSKYKELASALEKVNRAPIRMNLDKKPATAHLMIMNPLSGKGFASFFSTHPPVEKRIERLHKLAEQTYSQ